jgi:hypothetical protein
MLSISSANPRFSAGQCAKGGFPIQSLSGSSCLGLFGSLHGCDTEQQLADLGLGLSISFLCALEMPASTAQHMRTLPWEWMIPGQGCLCLVRRPAQSMIRLAFLPHGSLSRSTSNIVRASFSPASSLIFGRRYRKLSAVLLESGLGWGLAFWLSSKAPASRSTIESERRRQN